MYYVQESDKPKFWLKFFNAIELYEDKLILPVTESNEIDYKKAKIFSDKRTFCALQQMHIGE